MGTVSSPYPEAPAARDRWILSRRGPRAALDARRPYAAFVEEERGESGEALPVATVFLTNRECPWRCLMCDLWRHTLEEPVPPGAIPAQLDHALARLGPARHLKLYNNGSFFDPRAIPPADHAAIAQRVRAFERVIVECHPALVGDAAVRFRDQLSAPLEMAMGLETAHPQVLEKLNKRMTLEQFARAAGFLRRHDIALRVFILVQPPFLTDASGALHWAGRSLDFAFDCGATVASLIPTRAGRGALDALAADGLFAPPRLATLEAALEYGVSLRRGRVFADTWDLEQFSDCATCFPARRDRLARMNLSQECEPAVDCATCRAAGRAGIQDGRKADLAAGKPAGAPVSGPARSSQAGPRPGGDRRSGAVDFDLAIIGSGFGGSLLAMIARRLGHSVALIERGKHPRFAIGESSTPLANLLLEELAARHDLPRLAPLSKWGSWRQAHPEIACGLKRGFTFYHHRFGEPWGPSPGRGNELLVAASPHDGVADTHWFRAEFDEFLAREAQSLGAELMEETLLRDVDFSDGGATLHGDRQGARFQFRARFVIDASGARGFLQRALNLPETPFALMPETETLYSHFGNVRRWDELHTSPGPPPYPVDDAALHHVFDGGWIWVLRFNNGLTSAGVAATRALAAELNLADGPAAWARLLDRLPSVRAHLGAARAVRPFTHTRRLTFRCARASGRGWALLPSAAGFVDPLLSTGFPLTLLGVGRLARLLETGLEPAALGEYSALTLGELDAAAALVGALYAHFTDFEMFRALSLLYFAAASFSEAARRLGKPELAGSFLLHREESFGGRVCGLVGRAMERPLGRARTRLLQDIVAAIDPINVAGLGDPTRRHWYPVLASDLLGAAPKLGVKERDLQPLLSLFEPAAPGRSPVPGVGERGPSPAPLDPPLPVRADGLRTGDFF